MKTLLRLLIFISLLHAGDAFAQLQNTGWRRATNTHFPNDWTDPQYASGSDDFYAHVAHQSGCRCPFMDLSWDDGNNFTSSVIFGPYGETDSYRTNGDSTDNWGHAWTDSELGDSVFLLRIWNSSTLLKQGYSKFGFGIPSGSTISGIEVRVEAHGDSAFTVDYVDNIEMNVYYLLPTQVNDAYAADHEVSLFPNPAKNFFKLRFRKDVETLSVQVLNLQGQLVSSCGFSNVTAATGVRIDANALAPGIYFVNLTFDSKTVNTKLSVRQ